MNRGRRLRVWLAGLLAGSAILVLIVLAAIAIKLSTPRRISIAPDSVSIKTFSGRSGNACSVIDGDRSNYSGDLLGIGVRIDLAKREILLEKYVVRWHPFSTVHTYSDWPVAIDLDRLPAGTYDVKYWTADNGFMAAGKIMGRGKE